MDRSGSTVTSSGSSSPGSTRQVSGTESSTSAPASRSASMVISMCGVEGTGSPSWTIVTPSSKRDPASSSAETYCDVAEASSTTRPPVTDPLPWTTKGSVPRPSSSTRTPRPRRASIEADMGRTRACGSPSKGTGSLQRAATGGRKRMTVPARPQSMGRPPRRAAGVTSQSVPDPGVDVASSIPAPSWRSAWAMSSVSRERRGRRSREVPEASAAMTRKRLVRDLLPGSVTVPSRRPDAAGPGQSGEGIGGQDTEFRACRAAILAS